jgi:hypothetical protein
MRVTDLTERTNFSAVMIAKDALSGDKSAMVER